MASEGLSLLIKELSLGGVVGASAGVVLIAGAPLTALELKRALTGATRRVARRPAEPPILKSDMVRCKGVGWREAYSRQLQERSFADGEQVTAPPKGV